MRYGSVRLPATPQRGEAAHGPDRSWRARSGRRGPAPRARARRRAWPAASTSGSGTYPRTSPTGRAGDAHRAADSRASRLSIMSWVTMPPTQIDRPSEMEGSATPSTNRQRLVGVPVGEVPAEVADERDRRRRRSATRPPCCPRGGASWARLKALGARAPRLAQERYVVQHALVPARVLANHLLRRLRQVVQLEHRHRCHEDAPRGDGVAQRGVLGGPRGREAPERRSAGRGARTGCARGRSASAGT